ARGSVTTRKPKLTDDRNVGRYASSARFQGEGELSRLGGTYGVAVGAGVATLSDLGRRVSIFSEVPLFACVFVDFACGFSSDTAVVDRFTVFDFDVGTKCTDTGFG